MDLLILFYSILLTWFLICKGKLDYVWPTNRQPALFCDTLSKLTALFEKFKVCRDFEIEIV